MKKSLSLAALSFLAACTVGPNYNGPPIVASNSSIPQGFVRAKDQGLVSSSTVARWWEDLHDQMLTALIEQALRNSPTISIVQAHIREAGAQLALKHADTRPNVSANASKIRADLPNDGNLETAGSGGNTLTGLNYYNVGLSASWEPDLFGGNRRGIEQAAARVGERFAELADAQVTLSARVAGAYVELRAAQERERLDARSIDIEQRALEIARVRLRAGTGSALQVARLEVQLQTTEAQAVPVATQIDECLNQLAVLTGHRPGTLDASLIIAEPIPLPPREVHIGDPALLIAHRPDIRAAERALAASTAGVGVSKAQSLPGLRFFGILGIGGTSAGNVIDPTNLATVIAPVLSWAFLDFGRHRAAVRQATEQADAADAKYRETVLEALRDVESSLSRFGNTRIELARYLRAELSAKHAVELSDQRVAAGTSTVSDELDVERQRLNASLAAADSKSRLTLDYIAVQKSLGLGWTS